jgi:hypothetical protein
LSIMTADTTIQLFAVFVACYKFPAWENMLLP